MLEADKLAIPEFFTSVFNKTVENNILIIDEHGFVLAVNPAFTHNFGYTPDMIIGQKLAILFTPEDQKKKMPEHELKTVLERGHCFDNNYLVTAEGKTIWVSGESVRTENKEGKKIIIKAIQNIQLQKKSEAELERLNLFNDDILSTISDMVILLDNQMQLVKANKAFWQGFQLEDKNQGQINFGELINRYDKGDLLLSSIHKSIETAKNFSGLEVEIDVTGEEKKMFQASGNMLQGESGTTNLLLVLHDITMDKQLQREREDIIGFVAHELRNPLSNISLCNELIALQMEEKKYDEMPSMLHRSQNNLQRLNKMIEELYNATKINSGNLVLEIEDFDFGHMITEAIETTHIQQPDYRISVSGDTHVIVQGDRYRLMQVVTNYLSNGIKYSEGSTEVKLHVKHDESTLTVSVEDKGLGISAEQLPFIFKRFFRAEKTRNLEGLGLGLYLCQRIIFAHSGKVWVESVEGKGSIFYFSIPLAR